MLNWYNTGVTVELGELIASGMNLWDFEYPVPRSEITYNGKTCKVDFDKSRLEQKVIDHYRFRQIGQETPGRFLHYFRTRIREIMPYYVQLYEFDAKFRNIEDPLESYNLMETFKQETAGTGRVSGSATGQGSVTRSEDMTRKFSNTPQGSLNNLDDYMTEATAEDTNGTDTSTNTGTSEQDSEESGTVEHTLTRRGNIGAQPLGGEVQNIRSAFINIDMMIVEELNDLFLLVY